MTFFKTEKSKELCIQILFTVGENSTEVKRNKNWSPPHLVWAKDGVRLFTVSYNEVSRTHVCAHTHIHTSVSL